MTKQELIQLVKDEITVSGSLKLPIKDEEISRIIDMEKDQWYKNNRDAVELKMGVLKPDAFRTDDFRSSRTIQLPECVYGIQEFREIKDGSRLFGINDPDLTSERVFGSDLFLSPFSSDVITSRTISYSWFDLARSFTLIDIQFDFNWNTHRIKVIGHNPIAPVFIRAYVAIDEGDVYADYYFQRLIMGRMMLQTHRVLKMFETNAIGGVAISGMLAEQGQKYIDEVKEYIDKINVPDKFLMFC